MGPDSGSLLWSVLRRVAPAALRIAGWRVEGRPPADAKMVVVAAPHTSNWDYLFMLGAALTWNVRFSVFAKESLFRGPVGWFLRAMGGVPVDRSALNNLPLWAIDQFDRHERFMLVVTPEGTRGRSSHWMPGFYWIAVGAGVPILLTYADYRRKVVGAGPSFRPSGDATSDMARIRAFYDGVTARYPEQVGPIQLPPRRARPTAAQSSPTG